MSREHASIFAGLTVAADVVAAMLDSYDLVFGEVDR